MEINNWFENPSNYSDVIKHLGISQDQYLSIINSVKKVFSAEWAEEALAKCDESIIPCSLLPTLFFPVRCNPVPMFLREVSGGYAALVALIRLGQLIQIAENEPNVNEQKVFERLRGKLSDYVSALFELEVLETFKTGGFLLKKPMEADGVDFTFEKNNKEILIEASHRGASWILDLVEKICSEAFIRFSGRSDCFFISVKLIYRPLNDLRKNHPRKFGAVVEEIITNLVKMERGFLDGFKDPEGNYSISIDKSGNRRGIDFEWHDPTDLAYESEQLFKNKLQDKRPQLLRNPGSYCAIDMRSLMPGVVERRTESYNVNTEFLKRWLSC